MLSALFLAKLSAVLTVIYAGMNIHQLTSSYAYLLDKIAQVREFLDQSGAAPRLIRLNLFFYVLLPGIYLALLRAASMGTWALVLLAAKFALTAAMDIRAERRIVAGLGYTVLQHRFSRIDNIANLATAAAVLYLLFHPANPTT
jgi:hypothetical protein